MLLLCHRRDRDRRHLGVGPRSHRRLVHRHQLLHRHHRSRGASCRHRNLDEHHLGHPLLLGEGHLGDLYHPLLLGEVHLGVEHLGAPFPG